MPELPFLTYDGHFEGGALIADAAGSVLDIRHSDEGNGFVIADVEPQRVDPADPVPERYWMHGRGIIPAIVWNSQAVLGRRWYRRHVAGNGRPRDADSHADPPPP